MNSDKEINMGIILFDFDLAPDGSRSDNFYLYDRDTYKTVAEVRFPGGRAHLDKESLEALCRTMAAGLMGISVEDYIKELDKCVSWSINIEYLDMLKAITSGLKEKPASLDLNKEEGALDSSFFGVDGYPRFDPSMFSLDDDELFDDIDEDLLSDFDEEFFGDFEEWFDDPDDWDDYDDGDDF